MCCRCRKSVMVLCACGCGRYRKKFGYNDMEFSYISGHNDNWKDKRRKPIKCLICQQLFKAASTRQKLCGLACRAEWLRQNPPRAKKRTPIPCSVCGVVIWKTPCQQKTRETVCSKACQYKLLSHRLKGKNLSQPKRLAAQRDGYRCRVCGFDVLVEVHHIQPRKRNGGGGKDTLDNLITLCPNHHTMADRELLKADDLRALIATA